MSLFFRVVLTVNLNVLCNLLLKATLATNDMEHISDLPLLLIGYYVLLSGEDLSTCPLNHLLSYWLNVGVFLL